MYIDRKHLPDFITNLSRQTTFNIVECESLEKFRPCSGDGYRSIIHVFRDGIKESYRGSWGGSNMFEKSVDSEGISVDIEPGVYVVCGHEGGIERTYRVTTIYMNKADIPKVESGLTLEGLDDKEVKAFSIIRNTSSSYRKDYFARHGLGKYGNDNPHCQVLFERGLIKKAGAGMAVVPDARNLKVQEFY